MNLVYMNLLLDEQNLAESYTVAAQLGFSAVVNRTDMGVTFVLAANNSVVAVAREVHCAA